MTMPRFRSTAALSPRQRRAVAQVDRATFVVFTLGGRRLAVPVESVERVLRIGAPTEAGGPDVRPTHVSHAGHSVPLLTLEPAMRLLPSVPTAASRVVVFSVRDVWVAAVVDQVHEVAIMDASLVQPVGEEERTLVGARGRFERHGHLVIVLDMLAVVRAVYEAAQRVVPRT